MQTPRQNEPLSSLTHLAGVPLSITALILMIIFAVKYGQITHVIGFTIFGVSLIALYTTSALYHFFEKDTKLKNIFQRLDHAMIFILIAGTYTPIALVMPQKGWGWSIFGVVWGIALAGIIIKTLGIKMIGWLSVLIYILMGWIAIIAISPLVHWLNLSGLFWLFLGGAFYTFGCIFFGLEKLLPRTRWFGMHEIFHIFVLAGSFSHFWLMIKHLI